MGLVGLEVLGDLEGRECPACPSGEGEYHLTVLVVQEYRQKVHPIMVQELELEAPLRLELSWLWPQWMAQL